MSILDTLITFVNENVDFQQKAIARLAHSPSKQKFHQALLDNYLLLRNYLNDQQKSPSSPIPLGQPRQLKLSLTPDDLEGLPDDLLKQLSISDGDKTDFAILNLLEEVGGIASLDQLLIGLYKKTGEIMKRGGMTSKLYRMGQREPKLIWNVPGKKGVYSNKEITEAAATKLFGETSDNS